MRHVMIVPIPEDCLLLPQAKAERARRVIFSSGSVRTSGLGTMEVSAAK
jgi:hypothetical protein